MKQMRRIVGLLLAAALFMPYCTALALEAPDVTMQVTPSRETLSVGDYLTVTMDGVNTVDYALQVVQPDSTQAFFYDFPAVVPLQAEGMYVLIGYGVNTTDTAEPGFLRDMTEPAMFTVSGVSAALPEHSMTMEVMHDGSWIVPEGAQLDADNLRVQMHIAADAQISEDTVLKLTLLDDRGGRYPLVNAALKDVARLQEDGSYTAEITDYGLAANLLRAEYTEQSFSLEASLSLDGIPLAESAASFRINSYTNEMRYVNRFYDSSFRLGVSGEGEKLLTWLDMGERGVTERRNSGYLMLEQEYLHQQSWGYKLGHGYVFTANVLLDTISSLGLNAVGEIAENVICSAKFGSAGKSAMVYYQMLVNIYGDYVNEIIEKSMRVSQAAQDITDALGDRIQIVDEITGLIVDVVQSPDKDIACFKPEKINANQTPVIYRLLDVKESKEYSGVLTYVVSGPENSGMTVEMSAGSLLEPTKNGIPVQLDTTALIDKYGFDLQRDLIDHDASVWSVADAAKHMEGGAYSAEWANCDYLTLKASRGFSKLPEDVQKRIIEYGEMLDDTLSVTSIGISSVGYIAALSQASASQTVLFKLLAEMTDEYLLMLDQWEQTAEASDIEGKTDVVAAIRALKNDVLTTENDMASAIAQKANAFILTSDKFVDLMLEIAELAADKLGLDKIVKQKLAQGAKALAAKMGGKIPQALSALKLPVGGLAVIQIGSIVLSMMSEDYLNFHDEVKAVYGLKTTLTDSLESMLRAYGAMPTHGRALMIITALETLKSTKQIGEGLIEAYYLEDLYDDLDIDSMPDVRSVLWNEILLLRGTEELDISTHVTQFAAVYEDVDVTIKPQNQHRYKPGQKTYPITVLHGYYSLSTDKPAVYNNTTLALLPEEFQNVHITYRSMYYKLRLRRSGMFSMMAPPLTPLQVEAWWKGESVPVADMNRVYREYMYQYHGENDLDVILSSKQYNAVIDASEEINRILTTYSDDTSQIEWYDFKAKDEQQHQQRILWTKITHKYIDSFAMFDSGSVY